MSDTKLVLWQGGMSVTTVYGPTRAIAWHEMAHYVAMYEQDGPVIVKHRNRVIYDTDYMRPANYSMPEGL